MTMGTSSHFSIAVAKRPHYIPKNQRIQITKKSGVKPQIRILKRSLIKPELGNKNSGEVRFAGWQIKPPRPCCYLLRGGNGMLRNVIPFLRKRSRAFSDTIYLPPPRVWTNPPLTKKRIAVPPIREIRSVNSIASFWSSRIDCVVGLVMALSWCRGVSDRNHTTEYA